MLIHMNWETSSYGWGRVVETIDKWRTEMETELNNGMSLQNSSLIVTSERGHDYDSSTADITHI